MKEVPCIFAADSGECVILTTEAPYVSIEMLHRYQKPEAAHMASTPEI